MKKYLIAIAAAALPLTTNAAFTQIKIFISDIAQIVNALIIIVTGIAILVFFWGLAKFISHADNSKSHEEGRNLMIWGVIALFVMASVGGLVYFVQQNLGIDPRTIDVRY